MSSSLLLFDKSITYQRVTYVPVHERKASLKFAALDFENLPPNASPNTAYIPLVFDSIMLAASDVQTN